MAHAAGSMRSTPTGTETTTASKLCGHLLSNGAVFASFDHCFDSRHKAKRGLLHATMAAHVLAGNNTHTKTGSCQMGACAAGSHKQQHAVNSSRLCGWRWNSIARHSRPSWPTTGVAPVV